MFVLKVSTGATQASFLQFLTTFPSPTHVAQALTHGPLAQFGCQTASLWRHENFEELVRIGMHRSTEYGDDRYARISLAVNAPLTDSFNSSAAIIVPLADVTAHFPNLEIDQDFWSGITEQNGNGDVGHVPIVVNGVPLGVYVFMCNRINEWSPADTAILDALAAALGLWMSHPESKALKPTSLVQSQGLTLSPRQIEILSLIKQGKSNSAISARLGYSQSTIKQELRTVMRRLHVSSRDSAVAKATSLNLLPSPSQFAEDCSL